MPMSEQEFSACLSKILQGDTASYNQLWSDLNTPKNRQNKVLIEQRRQQAFNFFREAYKDKNDYANAILGVMYYSACGTKKDLKTARLLLLLAAKKNISWVDYYVAECCYNGLGGKGDPATALTYYLRLAKKGNLNAQLKVISLYDYGVCRNKSEAAKWRKCAAEAGNADCLYAVSGLDQIKIDRRHHLYNPFFEYMPKNRQFVCKLLIASSRTEGSASVSAVTGMISMSVYEVTASYNLHFIYTGPLNIGKRDFYYKHIPRHENKVILISTAKKRWNASVLSAIKEADQALGNAIRNAIATQQEQERQRWIAQENARRRQWEWQQWHQQQHQQRQQVHSLTQEVNRLKTQQLNSNNTQPQTSFNNPNAHYYQYPPNQYQYPHAYQYPVNNTQAASLPTAPPSQTQQQESAFITEQTQSTESAVQPLTINEAEKEKKSVNFEKNEEISSLSSLPITSAVVQQEKPRLKPKPLPKPKAQSCSSLPQPKKKTFTTRPKRSMELFRGPHKSFADLMTAAGCLFISTSTSEIKGDPLEDNAKKDDLQVRFS